MRIVVSMLLLYCEKSSLCLLLDSSSSTKNFTILLTIMVLPEIHFSKEAQAGWRRKKKKGRKKSWPEVFMVNLCNLCSWQCANVKSATCYGWWCFTGHFFHDSCCISDMKCKCQGSSQSLLAVTVIFLFGSVLFGQQKNHAPQFFRLTMKKGWCIGTTHR